MPFNKQERVTLSNPLTNDQIRISILELLHKDAQEDPSGMGVDNRDIAKALLISENIADFNLQYLKQKGLLDFNGVNFDCYWAKITAFGCDVVEHKNKFANQFPFVEVTIQNQNIQGNAYGVIQASGNAQATINQQQAFQQAYSKIENSDLKREQKDFLQMQVKELEQELQKGANADVNILKTVWTKIKENASWVIPMLAQTVTEGVKVACGVP
jgi:hypothetical protein